MKRLLLALLACTAPMMAAPACKEVAADKMIQEEDGTTIEIKPDGTKIVKKKDGTTVEVHPDGSKTVIKADGTRIEVPAHQ